MKLYGIFDVTAKRMVNVFLAPNDITAVRMNCVSDATENNSPLRRGFNLVKLGSADEGDILCRLVDTSDKLVELLEKENV